MVTRTAIMARARGDGCRHRRRRRSIHSLDRGTAATVAAAPNKLHWATDRAVGRIQDSHIAQPAASAAHLSTVDAESAKPEPLMLRSGGQTQACGTAQGIGHREGPD